MALGFSLKERIRHLLSLTPAAKRSLRRQLKDATDEDVERAVRRAVGDCPYYAPYADLLADGFDLKKLPIIRKKDIFDCSRQMVSRRVWRPLLMHKRTAGSTGIPLNVYYSPRAVIDKDCIPRYLFSLIGNDLKIGVLRDHTTNGSFVQPVGTGHWLFSPYLLSADKLDEYLAEMQRIGIDCLHVYPSALNIFARLIQQRYGVSPLKLKGIFASSEIFSREDKEFVMEVFPGVKIVDAYGHNELVVSAAAIDLEPFKFFTGVGYVEFDDTGERLPNGNRICEIVGTSIVNRTMPFIRYGTLDFAELAPDGNVVSIIGRSSDFIVNKDRQIVPCLFLNRRESTRNVINRQYYQPAVGKFVLRLVVNERFNDDDRRMLAEDLRTSFKDSFDCSIEIVPSIPRTKRGKQLRLVQDLNLDDFR